MRLKRDKKALNLFLSFYKTQINRARPGRIISPVEFRAFFEALLRFTGRWMLGAEAVRTEYLAKRTFPGTANRPRRGSEDRTAVSEAYELLKKWSAALTAEPEKKVDVSKADLEVWSVIYKHLRQQRKDVTKRLKAARTAINPKRKAVASRRNLKKAREIQESMPAEIVSAMKRQARFGGKQPE